MEQPLCILWCSPLPVLYKYGVWQRFVLPVPPINMGNTHEDVKVIRPDDVPQKSANTLTSTKTHRVLSILLKMYVQLQHTVGDRDDMSPAGETAAVFRLVASKTATLRTCGVPASKTDPLLAPVLDVVTLLRRR